MGSELPPHPNYDRAMGNARKIGEKRRKKEVTGGGSRITTTMTGVRFFSRRRDVKSQHFFGRCCGVRGKKGSSTKEKTEPRRIEIFVEQVLVKKRGKKMRDNQSARVNNS